MSAIGAKVAQEPDCAEARFWPRVAIEPGGCWLWTHSLRGGGYPYFVIGKRKVSAHRFSYELHVGPIPEGLQIDHLCHTKACTETTTCPHRRCVNPAHLLATTARANTLRTNAVTATNAVKTHCPQGHPYAGDNLVTARKRRARWCRICRIAKDQRKRARQRERLCA